MKTPPEVSVVIPLTDARGDAVEHLRTWTHGQTLPRERYQIVIASDGEEPEVDRVVAELLEPHDAFEVFPGAGLIELYNHAAGMATSPWLLFTENHCEGETDCLKQAVAGVNAAPDLEAASIEHGHLTPAPVGELGARWFDSVYQDWFKPGTWRRLNPAGFVIHRDAFNAAGGLDGRYGLFAAPLLAARLDEHGARVGHLERARILHVHVDDIDEHHAHSDDYAVGESEARESLDPAFAERYFGHQHLIWNRRALLRGFARQTIRVLFKELRHAGLRHRGDAGWLLREAGPTIPAAVSGARPASLLTRIAFAYSEAGARLPVMSRRRRYRHYLRAQERVVRLAQLRWIEAHLGGEVPPLPPGNNEINRIGEGTLVGVHGLERHEGRPFRWSEPVVTLRLDSTAAGEQLRIDTGGLRGSPLARVSGAYLETTRLTQPSLREDGATLTVAIPPGDGPRDLTLLCRPLQSQGDERRLGLPLFSLELRGAGSPDTPAAAVEHVPVS